MRILVVEPYKLPYEKNIEDTLENLQKEVDGYIEYAYMEDVDDVAIICNEEGIILGLEPNRLIGKDRGIFGTFLIVGNELNNDKSVDLTDEQINKYKEKFDEKSIDDMDEFIFKTLMKKAVQNNDIEIS